VKIYLFSPLIRLKDILKECITRSLFCLGYSVIKVKPLEPIHFLIKSLRPIKTNLIRIGGDSDGGYLIPNDLKGITKCFSPGVAHTSNFEKSLESYEIISFLADYSVDSPADLSTSSFFLKKFVAPYNSDTHMNFQDWISSNSKNNEDLILQMDIEGNEYATILSCRSEVLKRFRIMVIEFHSLDLIFDSRAFQIISNCFNLILNDFYVVHIHPNNTGRYRRFRDVVIPSTMEFTFIRKDRITDITYQKEFPHNLDRLNDINKSEVELPKNWWN
jgi:hypothetical protein